jgi:hypothetical protein
MAPRLCNISTTLLQHIQAMVKNWRSQRGRKWLLGDQRITYESTGKFSTLSRLATFTLHLFGPEVALATSDIYPSNVSPNSMFEKSL